MRRWIPFLLCLVLAAPVAAHDCTPGLTSDVTPRLSLDKPKAGQCDWDDELRAFFDHYDTNGAVLNLANTFTPKQTFTGGINIPGSTTGYCWVATDAAGNGGWATCGLAPGETLLDAYENSFSFMSDVSTIDLLPGLDWSNVGAGTVGLAMDFTEDPPILGTETAGNYVADVANGTCITGSPGATEGASMTLALDQTCSPTITGDWTFSGTLAVPSNTIDSVGEIAAGLRSNTTASAVKIGMTVSSPTDGCVEWSSGLLGSTGTPCGTGGGGGGDNISVNGAAATDANFVTTPTTDPSDLIWDLDTAMTPDQISATIKADAVGTAELDDDTDTPAADECVKVAADTTKLKYESCATNITGGISVDEAYCAPVEKLAAADLRPLVTFPVNFKVQKVGCHCEYGGTCTTPATLQFTDSANPPNLIGNVIPCGQGAGAMSFTDVSADADGTLSAGVRVKFDVTNTPIPDGFDTYLVCITFSKQ